MCFGVSIGYLLFTGSANATSPYSCSPRSGFTSCRRSISALMVPPPWCDSVVAEKMPPSSLVPTSGRMRQSGIEPGTEKGEDICDHKRVAPEVASVQRTGDDEILVFHPGGIERLAHHFHLQRR